MPKTPYTVAWEWPEGGTFEIVANLEEDEALDIETSLTKLLKEEGFSDVIVEEASGEESEVSGKKNLIQKVIVRALDEADFETISAALVEDLFEDT